jgi:hypothetical protein
LGNREKLQLADGYLARADRLWWDSRNVRGLPQEKDQIQRAADDYKRALELYQGVNATPGIVRVQNSLESVNFRLHQIDSGVPASGQEGASVKSGAPAAEILRRILRASKLIEQWQ